MERGEPETLSRRHAETCLGVAERLEREWYTAHERCWFRGAVADLDNFRVALGWSLAERSDLQIGTTSCRSTRPRLVFGIAARGATMGAIRAESIHEEIPARGDRRVAYCRSAFVRCTGRVQGVSRCGRTSVEGSATALDELQVARAREAAGSALTALGRGAEGEALLEGSTRRRRGVSAIGASRRYCWAILERRAAGAEISRPRALSTPRPCAHYVHWAWNAPRRPSRAISRKSNSRPAMPRRRCSGRRGAGRPRSHAQSAIGRKRLVQYGGLSRRPGLL